MDYLNKPKFTEEQIAFALKQAALIGNYVCTFGGGQGKDSSDIL